MNDFYDVESRSRLQSTCVAKQYGKMVFGKSVVPEDWRSAGIFQFTRVEERGLNV